MPSLWQLACGDGTPRAACGVAIVVGTVLTLINHGDVIIAGHMPDPLKVALTYAVPYVVATYGAVTAKRAAWRMRLAVQAEKTRP
ncbi:MAG: hypothetical protein D6826_02620 [Alphaproteobacteria bacterium]|nr:MAG: hypothetical protein D6826_02620 [Alphaproteobacteria bacterium]